MADTFEESFVQEHAEMMERYHRMADRAMAQFVIVRLGLVIGGAALPALTTLQNHGWSMAAAVLVAVLAGLDTQFQWGTEWQHFRSTELALGRLKREYLRQKELADRKLDPAEQAAAAASAFDAFYRNTEDVLEAESQKFWRFRITRFKQAKAR